MFMFQRRRKFDPREIRAIHRPRLEILEDRTLLSICTVQNANDSGANSLRSCMSDNFTGIEFENEPLDIQLLDPLPVITWTFTITGPDINDPGDVIVRGGGESDPFRVFTITSTGDVDISNLTISGGFADSGGGIKNEGTLVLDNVVVEDNVAAQLDSGDHEIYGGGIWSSGDITITNGSRIQNNKVMGSDCVQSGDCPDIFGGGGIFLDEDVEDAVISDGSFVQGNVVCDLGDFCFGRISIEGNDAVTYYGGGIYSKKAVMITIVDSTIDSNQVIGRDSGDKNVRVTGGGIAAECYGTADPNVDPPCLAILNSTISRNSAEIPPEVDAVVEENILMSAYGGGISMAGGVLPDITPPPLDEPPWVSIVNSTIAANVALTDLEAEDDVNAPCNAVPLPDPPPAPVTACRTQGGGIWFKWLVFDIRHTTIVGNETIQLGDDGEIFGGGIFGPVIIEDQLLSQITFRSTLMDDNLSDGSANNIEFAPVTGHVGFVIVSEGFNLLDDAEPDNWDQSPPGGDDFSTESCFVNDNVDHGLDDQWGGPTETLRPKRCNLLIASIPALDNGGDGDNLSTDQRGEDRVVNGANAADRGSFECQTSDCSGSAIPPPPDDGFGPNDSDVSNESGSLFDQDRTGSMPADAPSAPAKPTLVFSGSAVGRVLPVRPDVDALWQDALLTLGI